MDTLSIKRKKPRRSSARKGSSPMFLPEELLAEILPFFNVKNIMRLKCLSKSWMTFISDSNFVQKHLKNSSQNPHLTLFWYQRDALSLNFVPIPVYHLLKNPCINLYSKTFEHSKHRLEKRCEFVGSCDGLLCLLFYSETSMLAQTVQLYFWNPATRTTSEKLQSLCYSNFDLGRFHFTFGYDASKRTYKVVAFRARENGGSWKSEVKVFSVGHNCWRNIQSFPVVPGRHLYEGVHFSGTVNWLAKDKSIKQFVIVSLDLSTETYKQFLLPPGFDEVPFFHPVLRVLMDCLCFSHDSNKTEFVIWQMKQYGVQESWNQLFKISDQNLLVQYYGFPLECLYVNGDMAIIADQYRNQAFLYNLKDKTIMRIKSKNSIHWFDKAKDYVESLVSVC